MAGRKFGTSIVLPGDPSAALEAAPKQYVDLRELASNKGASNGYAPLVSGVVPYAYYQYATGSTDGSVVLAGDLGGTATAPTVPALANKAPIASPTFTGVVTVPCLVIPPRVLTDAATIATDASLGNHHRVTLAGNRTLGNPTNMVDGQRLTWELIQDATGSRTLAFGSAFAFGLDIPSVTLTTTASKRDFLSAIYNSGTSKWYVVAFARGY